MRLAVRDCREEAGPSVVLRNICRTHAWKPKVASPVVELFRGSISTARMTQNHWAPPRPRARIFRPGELAAGHGRPSCEARSCALSRQLGDPSDGNLLIGKQAPRRAGDCHETRNDFETLEPNGPVASGNDGLLQPIALSQQSRRKSAAVPPRRTRLFPAPACPRKAATSRAHN